MPRSKKQQEMGAIESGCMLVVLVTVASFIIGSLLFAGVVIGEISR